MTFLRFRPVVFALLVGAGCSVGPDTPPVVPPPVVPPPPPVMMPPTEPPPPAPAVYKRASMAPLYQLTPNAEFDRFTIGGVKLADTDFQLVGGGFADSSASKLDVVAQQIAAETGLPAPTIVSGIDRGRAQLIPFRGNPSDIDLFTLGNGQRKAYVAVGGDLMAPGNEVAAINLNNGVRRLIQVGVHPQRTAVHPAGLIFVCNQFSNYISVIDPERDELLKVAGKPVEVKTDFYCTDLAFVPRSVAAPDNDKQDLWVSNGWRGAVYKYSIDVVRDNLSNDVVDIKVTSTPGAGKPESEPTLTVGDGKCGANPFRLSVGTDLRSIFVANNRGGEIGKLDLATGTCTKTAVKGPVPQVVQANDIIVMATTTLDRGFPSQLENSQGTLPSSILARPLELPGVDGAKHVAHPGAQFDNTQATNFEDLRNGLLTMNLQLSQPTYFTDDISSEKLFAAQQKIIGGSLPMDIVVNKGATKAFVALSGSDQIQQFDIKAGNQFRLFKSAVPLSKTDARPFALALDEKAGEIVVANWGGETIQIFDINTGLQKGNSIDAGFANLTNAAAQYPATTIERGEYLYYNTAWSNNGRKSCASCHFDELLVDGIEYANGATAPTFPHKIPANFNLATTDSYFWNGSFGNGSYAALASDFQGRSNCELIAFGYVEGISSDPLQRIGDPANKHTLGAAGDQLCRPQVVANKILPANFDTIVDQINATRAVRDLAVGDATAAGPANLGRLNFAQAARNTDFYSNSELRLPPNPLAYLAKNSQLDSATAAAITQGKALFVSAGCNNCHQAENVRHPYADGQNHGSGSNWAQSFINRYQQDDRVLDILEAAGLGRAIPAQMIASAATHTAPPDREINVHLPGLDFFQPGCFDDTKCLQFDDPASAPRDSQLETDRLEAIVKVNLANADRGFVPGNVTGSPQANTPAIRGNWWQHNFLRHGLAHSLREAILGPGHPELAKAGPGTIAETGFAIDILGNLDVHGATSKMTKAEVDALVLFVQSIE